MAEPLPIPPYKIKRSKLWLILGIFLVIILLAGAGTYGYFQYYLPQQAQKPTEEQISPEDTSLVAKVRELMELPEEEPTIATVSDVSKLKGQPFFDKAENGDKVLIFKNSGKAVLYRPSSGKIIEVGPVTMELPEETASSSGKIVEPLRVVLYNGSSTVGITQDVEDEIVNAQPEVEIVEKENARRKTYPTTQVIDLSGNHSTEAQILAELLAGSITELPEGETSPEADILIIVGNDYTNK